MMDLNYLLLIIGFSLIIGCLLGIFRDYLKDEITYCSVMVVRIMAITGTILILLSMIKRV